MPLGGGRSRAGAEGPGWSQPPAGGGSGLSRWGGGRGVGGALWTQRGVTGGGGGGGWQAVVVPSPPHPGLPTCHHVPYTPPHPTSPEHPRVSQGAPVPPVAWGRLWALARPCPTAAHPQGHVRAPPPLPPHVSPRHTCTGKVPTAGAATAARLPHTAAPAPAPWGAGAAHGGDTPRGRAVGWRGARGPAPRQPSGKPCARCWGRGSPRSEELLFLAVHHRNEEGWRSWSGTRASPAPRRTRGSLVAGAGGGWGVSCPARRSGLGVSWGDTAGPARLGSPVPGVPDPPAPPQRTRQYGGLAIEGGAHQ